MANRIFDDADIQNIANAIREKNGSSNTYLVSEMGDAIRDIPIPEPKLGTLEVTENGVYKASEIGGGEETFTVTVDSEFTATEFGNAHAIKVDVPALDLSTIDPDTQTIDLSAFKDWSYKLTSDELNFEVDGSYEFPYHLDADKLKSVWFDFEGFAFLRLQDGTMLALIVPSNIEEILTAMGLPSDAIPAYLQMFPPNTVYLYDLSSRYSNYTVEFTWDSGESKPIDGFSEVVVNVPAVGFYTTEENESGGLTYRFSAEKSDVVEFNIAYGDTEPTDTSKLWVKTTEPSAVKVDSEIEKVPSDECSATIIDSYYRPGNSGCAQVGTKLYYVAGYYNGYTRSIFTLDLETQKLVELAAKAPQNLSHPTASAVGTKIYIFGGAYGSNYYDKIYCFDTVTETISTLEATLPTKTNYSASVSVGSKIYIFGGKNDSGRTNQIVCFDSENLTISQLNTVLPTALESTRCVAYGNNIYLFGGQDDSGTYTDKILKFNCETEIITTCAAKLPKGLSGSHCALMEDTILILGGYWSNSIYLFDCNSETITTLSVKLPENKYMASMGVLDNSVWLYCGLDGYSNSSNTILFTFGMSVILSADILQVQSTLDRNIFNLLNTDNMKVKMGVNAVFKGNADGIGEQVEAALHNGTSWVTI